MRSGRHRPSVEIIGKIAGEEVIAVGGKIRKIERLRKVHGRGHWRKMKGIAVVRLPDGTSSPAEVHWYESHGVGRKEFKIKRLLGVLR
jgi:hypothetical protein